MAYETKVLLKAVAQIIKANAKGEKDKEPYRKMYNEILEMANVEGIILKPFDDESPKND